jgi:anti-sigma factor RsiW
MSVPRRMSDGELHALVDGELIGEEAAAMQAALVGAPADVQFVRDVAALNERLEAGYAGVLSEPVPDRLKVLASRIPERGAGLARRMLMLAAAMAMTLAAGAAGYGMARYAGTPNGKREAAFVTNALTAHSLYVPEMRHPVEVGASEEQHLVKWLTRRVGAAVRAPELAEHGWTLMGGRLLPDRGQPAAQLMYEDGGGRRLTLYVRKETALDNAAFRFTELGDFAAFYWIDRPLAYALAGRLERDELMGLASSIYAQLGGSKDNGSE